MSLTLALGTAYLRRGSGDPRSPSDPLLQPTSARFSKSNSDSVVNAEKDQAELKVETQSFPTVLVPPANSRGARRTVCLKIPAF